MIAKKLLEAARTVATKVTEMMATDGLVQISSIKDKTQDIAALNDAFNAIVAFIREKVGYTDISNAAPIIEELITKEKVDESKSAYLGISGLDVTSDLIQGVEIPNGVYVVTVFENTAAANYGIRPGDIIVKFDEKEISTMESLTSTLQYYEAGSTVKITVMRSDKGQYQELELDVVLGKKN